MVNRVNPPPHVQIPQKYTSDRSVADYHQQIGRILFQLWTRVGGGSTDAIDALESTVNSLLTRTTTLETKVSALETKVATIEDELENFSDVYTQITSLRSQVSQVRESVEDLEL